MEIVIFGRFHARPGREPEVEAALREVQDPTRAEPGCLEIHLYRSVKDAGLFYVHSRWRDMAAFERHAELPHTLRMLARVEPLLAHPLDVTRSVLVS